jgi:glycogen debranching enzyme
MNTVDELKTSFDKLRTKEGYIKAAYPGYNRIFGRDSLIVAWQMIDIEPEIARKILLYLGEHQATSIDSKAESEPGKILHEDSEGDIDKGTYDWKWPYYGSIDSTPLYIILAGFYLEKTGDTGTITKLWPQLTAAMKWIYQYGDMDGDHFIEYQRRNPKGLFHQGWKDSPFDSLKIQPPVAMVEVQGYAYAAYQTYASLAGKLDRASDNSELASQKAALLKEHFHEKFFIEREKYYGLALDGSKHLVQQITSNPGHLLFTGILNDDQNEFVIQRLMKSDLMTNFGIRTLSDQDSDFESVSYHRGSIWPHDNWIIYFGLKTLGHKKYANTIKEALLRTYTTLHSIPELYAVETPANAKQTVKTIKDIVDLDAPPNMIQAWALAGLIDMVENPV